MRTWKFIIIILSFSLLSSPLAFCQTEESKTAVDQQDTTTNKDKKTTPAKKPPIKPSSKVPEIELTNARLTFENTTYNFGSIPKGAKVTHNFWFENTGSDTLVINRVRPT
jgi:hypothetical protein